MKSVANELAEGMEKFLNSEENKKLFSKASMIEKLAFKKVSEEEQPTEIEIEMQSNLNREVNASVKTAAQTCHACKGYYIKDKDADKPCTCGCPSAEACKAGCSCHSSPAKPLIDVSTWTSKASTIVGELVKVSTMLEDAGFDKLASDILFTASELVSEAKAKSKSSKSKSDKKESKESKKSKMNAKERMEKMRAAKDKKKKDSKTSKK